MRLCPAWGTGGLWVPLPVAAALTRVRWCRSLGSQLLFSLCNYEVSCRELLCDFVNVPSRLLLWLTNFSLRPRFLPGIAAYAFDERASPRPSPLHGYYSACAVRGVASPHVWIEAMIYTIWTHGRLFYSIGHDPLLSLLILLLKLFRTCLAFLYHEWEPSGQLFGAQRKEASPFVGA